MNEQPKDIRAGYEPIDLRKFVDPQRTVKGDVRAEVSLNKLETLWINTGTLCNIECKNCYINSSPTNDQLVYFSLADALALYDEIEHLQTGTVEIGFTGGEPFMNPQILEMIKAALERGFRVLVLSNAMQPLQRKKIKQGLVEIAARFGDRLTIRVSLDHYTKHLHEVERGENTWSKTIAGLNWLSENHFNLAIAGRTCWGEAEVDERDGYAQLIARYQWPIDPYNAGQLILFPEMNEQVDVPEITTACWAILGKSPDDIMCSSSRMVIRRKGAAKPALLPCTLLPHDAGFEMGATIDESLKIDGGNFSRGSVKLNHPHCAKFCVLGGGSCTA